MVLCDASSEAAATNGPPPDRCGLRCNWNWRNRSPLVICYFMLRPDVVFLADLYAKNEKENLTHAERNQLQKIASEIQREFGG